MSTTSLVPPSATDPRLITEVQELHSEDEYRAVLCGEITPRYASLRLHTQKALLTLAQSWEFEDAGQRLADCGRFGSVYKKCKKGNTAKAHRHTCHMWICFYCGQPHNLLHCWARTRTPEVRTERQVGVEVIGPLGAKGAVAAKLAQWLRRRGIDSVRRRVLEAKPRNSRVRFVLHTEHLAYNDTLAQLRKIAGVGWSIQPYRESDPVKVLKWMFASTESLLTDACGHTAARVLMQNDDGKLLATVGDFYREYDLPKPQSTPDFDPSEVEDDPSERFSDPDSRCNCGECDGIMESIPWYERVQEPVDRINDSYPKGVDWSGCHDPFKVARKKAHTSNFMGHHGDPAAEHTASHAPPS